jgi:hypothetical protein
MTRLCREQVETLPATLRLRAEAKDSAAMPDDKSVTPGPPRLQLVKEVNMFLPTPLPTLANKPFIARSREHLPDCMFPGGAPGAAMLLLRIALAGNLANGAADHWLEHMHVHAFAAMVPIMVLLVAGAFSTFAASLSAIIAVVLMLTHTRDLPLVEIIVLLNALVVVLLGPGAYSLDALKFGRRSLPVRMADE